MDPKYEEEQKQCRSIVKASWAFILTMKHSGRLKKSLQKLGRRKRPSHSRYYRTRRTLSLCKVPTKHRGNCTMDQDKSDIVEGQMAKEALSNNKQETGNTSGPSRSNSLAT